MEQVLSIFREISAIPRCSGQEEKIRAYFSKRAEKNGFAVRTDGAGNLLISVPASPGQEEAPTIVLQGHLDMVCEKTPASGHDFEADPLRLRQEGDWLLAEQTTLGADNGAGLAIAMALAEDRDCVYPPLELLFTADEETGLNGASRLEPGFFSGKILINLDSEDEGVFTIGCAGGRECTIIFPPVYEAAPAGETLSRLEVHGLQGGHSGINIGERRGNANVLLGRLLGRIADSGGLRLGTITGGSAHNAIAREAAATFLAAGMDEGELAERLAGLEQELREEFPNEKRLAVTLAAETQRLDQVMTRQATSRLLDLLQAVPDGMQAMSREVAGLVETSLNFATIREDEGEIRLLFSLRSDKEHGVERLSRALVSLGRLAGARVQTGNSYPGWQPDLESDLLARAREVYRGIFDREPVIEIIHAGLECGIIGAKHEGMEMISFGPTIKNPHSPEEKLFIPSLANIFRLTADLLAAYCR